MRKLIFSLIALVLLFNCTSKKDGYTINGTIDNIENGKKVSLRKFEERKPIDVDSATVQDGKFTLSGAIDKPDVYFIYVESVRGNLPLILENTELNITAYKDSLNKSIVEGSIENDLAKDYVKSMETFNNEAKALASQLTEARKNNDTAFMRSYQSKRMEINKKNEDFTKDYIKKSNNSVFGMVLLENFFLSSRIKFEEAQAIFNSYSEDARNSAPGLRIKDRIDSELATSIGAVAPDFSAKNPQGEDVSLSDVKGKVTIVDFWAAWCGPCRRENPNLVKLYNKYHEKGLEIIGISLDGNPRQKNAKAEWMEAIEKDSLTWHHISNLNYFNGPIAQKYNIRSIPASFVLDSEGKIVAKNLRGKAMEDKIAELLD